MLPLGPAKEFLALEHAVMPLWSGPFRTRSQRVFSMTRRCPRSLTLIEFLTARMFARVTELARNPTLSFGLVRFVNCKQQTLRLEQQGREQQARKTRRETGLSARNYCKKKNPHHLLPTSNHIQIIYCLAVCCNSTFTRPRAAAILNTHERTDSPSSSTVIDPSMVGGS